MIRTVAKLLKVVAADTGGSDGCSGVVLEPWILLQLDEDLQRARCIVVDGDASSLLLGHAHGKFLRMFLGPINVRASRKDVQLKDYKYVRILGAFYLQLTGSDTDVYHYLEPLYNDYRKLRRKLADGHYTCDIAMSRIKKRYCFIVLSLFSIGTIAYDVTTVYCRNHF
ncbi:pre-mRNA-splicing factor 38-like isoform X3 [Vicia villosa]|uniref:pre-mRNA-splicing factor 38-like isoform X3 n=1 Tax=Vicia villosa TaxID=3911 RepID=UPI00273B3123|nr:pre-mRNA-splicing factor 38-like isoform X3 [Vicia villosa]